MPNLSPSFKIKSLANRLQLVELLFSQVLEQGDNKLQNLATDYSATESIFHYWHHVYVVQRVQSGDFGSTLSTVNKLFFKSLNPSDFTVPSV